MQSPTKSIHVESTSEAGPLLKEADDSPVEIEAGGTRYLVTRLDDPMRGDFSPERSDSIMDLIGIGASSESTDIARHKCEYLADAIDHLCGR
jgi:hypothetical protein